MNTVPFYRFIIPCLSVLLLQPAYAASTESEPSDTLEVNIETIMQPWTGDLPGMQDRRVIRVLTTYSKTFFHHQRPAARGNSRYFRCV